MRIRSIATAGACAVLAFGVAACGGDNNDGGGDTASSQDTPELAGTISGAGASSQAAAKTALIAGFQQNNPDAEISYDPIGSGGGREQFVAGGTAFGGTDSAFEGDELQKANQRCGELIELPVYISPVAVVYNLDGVEDLQLSPATIAGLMNGDIKTWNDPKVAADNPGKQLPSSRVTPVNRSDESGTTENFTEYLSATAGDVWTDEPSGEWPIKGGEAADGTSGVIEAVGAGSGTIGYADASQAKDVGVAKIKVGDEYVAPSAEGAAKAVESSDEADGANQFRVTYDLKRDLTDPTTYPLVLVSYDFACQRYDDKETADLVKGFLNYEISPEGQQQAAKAAGSAPISEGLRTKMKTAVDGITAGQ